MALFYFVWQFGMNNTVHFTSEEAFAQSDHFYLSPNYTFVDVTILTGEVQKETFSEYIVQQGQTIAMIAKQHDLNVASILEANNINPRNADIITPGTIVLIPTEDLSDSDEWLVASNERLSRIAAERERARAQAARVAAASQPRATSGRNIGANRGSNLYPYGYCTWYVASRRAVPRWGNAGQWLFNARAAGYSTGSTPTPGSIFVSTESPIGHVGIVEAVHGNTMTLSEMNYAGFGKVSRRVVPTNFGKIRGYIY